MFLQAPLRTASPFRMTPYRSPGQLTASTMRLTFRYVAAGLLIKSMLERHIMIHSFMCSLCVLLLLYLSLNQYMAFGLSGLTTQTFMIGADATVAWVDNRDGTPNAVDYFLTQRVQCRAGEGACPDTMVTRNNEQCTNDVRSGSVAGGIRNENQQCIIFSRPFSPSKDARTC